MYQLQFINLDFNPSTLTKEQLNLIQQFLGNWKNQSLQKSISIRYERHTHLNQYQIIQIDSNHQRIKILPEDNQQIIYTLDYEDAQHILIQTSIHHSYGTSRPIRYEK